jgi:hypothetical protein
VGKQLAMRVRAIGAAAALVDRRAFVGMALAGAASSLLPRAAHAQGAPKARNVVLVHGLFADGSCWSEVIARLQGKGMQVTAVQNPLTTLQASPRSAAGSDGAGGPFLRRHDPHRGRRRS